MKKSTTIDLMICDSCAQQKILGDSGDQVTEQVPEGWFHGTVIYGNDQDEIAHEWSACREAHIKTAVQNVLDLL